MPRYTIYFLPSLTTLFVWFCSYFKLNTDFVVPTILFFMLTYGTFNFRRFSNVQKLIFIYVAFSALAEVFAYYWGLVYQNNHKAYHFFCIIQTLLYTGIYSYLLMPKKKYRYLLWLICGILLVVELLYSFVFRSVYLFPSLNIVLLSGFVLTLSLFQFRRMILFPVTEKLENQPIFWFNFGTLIAYSFGFFFLGFLSTTKNLPDEMYTIWWGTAIFLCACYFMSLYLDDQPTKPIV